MEFEEKIKAELKKRGLDESLVGKIKIDKEEEIEQAVYDLKLQTELQKNLQKEVDQAVTKAITTREEKLTKEFEAEKEKIKKEYEQKKTGETDEDDKVNKLVAEKLKSLSEIYDKQIKNLNEKLEKNEKQVKEDKRESLVIKKLKDAEMSEKFVDYITGEEEEKIDEQINFFKQQIKDKEVEGQRGTLHSKGTAVDSLITSIVEEKNKGVKHQDFQPIELTEEKDAS